MLISEKRPQRLKDLMGQAKAKAFLSGWVKEHKDNGTDDVFLISGPSGVGKTSIAYALAGELGVDEWSMEFISSGNCNIDTVRGIVDSLNHSNLTGGKWKIVVVDEAHCMSDAAKNAWLSALENLPNYRLVIFTTTEPKHFDLVWRSRCKMIELNKIIPSAMFMMLKDAVPAGRDVPAAVLNGICDKAAGNMRAAYQALEQHLLTVPSEEDQTAVAIEEAHPPKDKTCEAEEHDPTNAECTCFNKPQYTTHPDSLADSKYSKLTPSKRKAMDELNRLGREHAERMAVKLEGVSFELKPGTRDGFIEIHFSGKPSEEVRNELKTFKFRWSNFNKCWYGKEADLPNSYRLKEGTWPTIKASESSGTTSTAAIVESELTSKSSKDVPSVQPEHAEKCETPVGASPKEQENSAVQNAKSASKESSNGLDVIVVAPVGFLIVHKASGNELGFPVFADRAKAEEMVEKIADLTDWTQSCEDIMAIAGMEEKLAAFMPSEALFETNEKEEAAMEVAAENPEPPAPVTKSWKLGCKTASDSDWSFNAMRYATKEECEEAGRNLFSRWMALKEYLAIECDDPVYPTPKVETVTPKVIEEAPKVSMSELKAEKVVEVMEDARSALMARAKEMLARRAQ